MAKSDPPRHLLARILETPHLAHVIPRLQPELLHRVIQRCGLEDCGELVALATADQLRTVLDLDLWRSDQPGLEEQFDADRFGVWLEVLVESGAAFAAQKLAGMDLDLIVTALSQHVRVFDPAAVSPVALADGDEEVTLVPITEQPVCEVGGYAVVPRRTDSWDAIVTLLVALDEEHTDYFHRVMRGCRGVSNSTPEVDGLDDLLTDREQVMFDLAFSRERRRERLGYVTPAEAQAFLQSSRERCSGKDSKPPDHPTATAYFRALDGTTSVDANDQSDRSTTSGTPFTPAESTAAVAAMVEVLVEAGVVPQRPRALLEGPTGPGPRLTTIQTQMQFVLDRDDAAYSVRSGELAFLANVILAGCSIQARPFTAQDAWDGAVAVCNLGLENWPAPPENFLVAHDLVSVFQVGWTVLYRNVCLYSAEHLVSVLTRVRTDDHEIQADLDRLRAVLARHWRDGAPWRAHNALDVIAILDMPSWAVLLGLTGEFPVMHAGIDTSRRTRAVSASAFEFISENSQMATVRDFLESLPERLSP